MVCAADGDILLCNPGQVSLDATLQSLGVVPRGKWAPGQSGAGFFQNVTVQDVLSQTTGVGLFPPRAYFTYDSDVYLSNLRYVLEVVTGQPSQVWATENFAVPLGLDSLYMSSNDAGGVNIGGGQMMSCRDMAKVGQLIVNGGRWPDGNGGARYGPRNLKSGHQLMQIV